MTTSIGPQVQPKVASSKKSSFSRKSLRPLEKYTTRSTTWEEQLRLPARFHQDGEGVWPAERIIAQEGKGKKIKYLVEWESHPETGEWWQDSWIPASNIGADLLEPWEAQRTENCVKPRSTAHTAKLQIPLKTGQANEETEDLYPRKRQKRNTSVRVIHSSSDTEEDIISTPQKLKETPPRPVSQPSSSGLEIQETQEIPLVRTTQAVIPLPTVNLSDYESIPSTQASNNNSTPNQTLTVSRISNQESQLHGNLSLIGLEGKHSSIKQPPHRETPQPLLGFISKQSKASPSITAAGVVKTNIGDPFCSTGSETEPSSPATTESSSDLFFPSPHRSQSSASPPADHLTSNSSRQIIAHVPKSSEIFTQEREFRTPSRERHFETSANSQASSGYSPPLQRSISLNIERSLNTSQQRKNHLKMAAIIVEKSSPRLRSSTPATDRKLEPRTPFEERVQLRRAQKNLNEARSPVIPSIRQPTPITLGIATTSVSQTNENSRSKNQAAESPLRNHVTMDSISAIIDESVLAPALGDSHSHSGSDAALGAREARAGLLHLPADDEQTSNSNSHSESGNFQIQKSIESELVVPLLDIVRMPTFPIIGPGEYVIPLPADGRVQSVYIETIRSKKKALLKYISKSGSSGLRSANRTPDATEMAELVDRLNDTVTHVDLALDTDNLTQYSLNSEDNARYATYAGSKFAFLDLLIDQLQSTSLSLLIFAKPGRVQALLEGFLVLKGVLRSRASDGATFSPEDADRLTVDLRISESHSDEITKTRPALIIGFDSSFYAQDSQIKTLKTHFPDLQAPIIHLVVPNSSEHIDRCLPRSMPSPQRLRLLVRSTYLASRHLGHGLPLVRSSSDAANDQEMNYQEGHRMERTMIDRQLTLFASDVANALKSVNFEAAWTALQIPAILFDEFLESPPRPSRALSLTPVSRPDTPSGSGRKRLLDAEIVNANAKRQRLTPLHDVTPISDSAKDPFSQLDSAPNALQAVLGQIELLKKEKQASDETRNYTQQRLEEETGDLSRLQRRYETRTKLCHGLQKEIKQLAQDLADEKAKREKANRDVGALKDEVAQIKVDLAAARVDLVNAGGDVSALEQARQEARTALAENASLLKKQANDQRDFEFMRTEYQKVSSKAFEFTTQISELEVEAVDLRAQASGEKRRLKELSYTESINQHLAKVAELELEKKNRDVVLKKLEEEVRGLKKNRGVQTRGSSVQPPGSPGARSRQGSPGAGHLGLGIRSGGEVGTSLGSRASVLRHER